MTTPHRLVIEALTYRFRDQKQMAEKAVLQLPDDQWHVPLDANTNPLAVIMKHMAGNLRSRFTDFLTRDGEKPDRDRDGEFVDDRPDRAAVLADWESGWEALFAALAPLADDDLARTITIRGQPHTVADALARALAHQSYHVGQIVQLARFLAKDQWQTLTIPRNASRQFNEAMREKFGQ
jgi:uncharacterized damage-inducible protein DinB